MAGQQSGGYADTWDFDPGDKNPDNVSPEEQRQARNPWSSADASNQFLGTPGNSGNEQGYTTGNIYDPGSWGGVGGRAYRDPVTGELKIDKSATGAKADVERYQQMAQGARARTGPQTDYSVADAWAGRAGEMRGEQGAGIGMSRDMALGINSQSQKLGQSMINQGVNAQRSVAASRRGGPLSAASALAGQQAGEAGFRAGANASLAGVLAREQAMGRQQFLGAGLAQRQGDLMGQGLSQQQGIFQGQMDRGQRALNDQAELEYESMGADTNQAQAAAQIERFAGKLGVAQKEDQLRTAGRQDARGVASAVGDIGTGAAKAGAQALKSPAPEEDPKKLSDRRAKNIADWY
jgi:hypothetical protein